ncbi:MAG TPA: hypothetical protein VJT32_06425 [bacterium]|nr:hypothetical protein [bacterium]
MNAGPTPRPLIIEEDPKLYTHLARLAREGRMVLFAGLPGTGKSLFIHQLAHLAHAAGRAVHLLQWDVVRPLFEASPAGSRYPVLRGVTHAVIRKAAGAWVREAVAAWCRHFPEPGPLLIGETPLVGNRFVELARRGDDAIEPLLTATSCHFVIPVPSRTVRRFLEAERDRRLHRPEHHREREDAPAHLLQQLWEQLLDAAPDLGVAPGPGRAGPRPYDPTLYERIYRHVLRHRHVETLDVEKILSSGAISVYAFTIPTQEIVPTPSEVAAAVAGVERAYPDSRGLQREIDRWYEV